MKFNEEQFNKEIGEYRKLKLSDDARLRIKTKLEAYVSSHPAKVTSPYFNYFHFSYKVAFTSLVLILSLSLGTAYASQSSLPGDLLYKVKTNITEPAIKLSKISVKAKEDFELHLADERIKEIKQLAESGKLTQERLDTNLSLFERHIEEKRKDKEESKKEKELNKNENKEEYSNQRSDLNLRLNVNTYISDENEEDETELDSRIDMYRDVMLSKPELRDLYEYKAKARLDKKRARFSNKENIKDMDSNETSESNKFENNQKLETESEHGETKFEQEIEIENESHSDDETDDSEDLKVEIKDSLFFR